MPAPHQKPFQRLRKLQLLPVVLLILSLACSLPGLPQPSPSTPSTAPRSTLPAPSPTSAPKPTPTPLPPALVESDPPPGSEIPLKRTITFYFSQPMNRATVEGAISGQPSLSGRFTWHDDNTLTFTPDLPLLPGTDVQITLGSTAQSKRGLALANPLTLSYHTVGYLRLTQVLPQPGSQEIDPSSAVVAVFNRPVVPLGAEPEGLPPALTVSDANGVPVQGKGEWINTSTYLFHAEPAMAGGARYNALINPQLSGVDGSPMEEAKLGTPDNPGKSGNLTHDWSFSTARPRLESIQPENGATHVGLQPKITLTFNQAMDPESVKAGFTLRDPNSRPVEGTLLWSDDHKVLTFTPTGLLARGTNYTISLPSTTQAFGGTPLGVSQRAIFHTVSELGIESTQPGQAGLKRSYDPIVLNLLSQIPDKDPLAFLSVNPAVPNLNAYVDPGGLTLRVFGDFEPATTYSLSVSANLTDLWGSSLAQPFTLNFQTAPLDPSLTIAQAFDLLFITPRESSLPAQAANLPQVGLELGEVPFQDFKTMLAPGGYDFRKSYLLQNSRNWTQPLELPPNRMTVVELPLNSGGAALTPGIYMLRASAQAPNLINSYLIVVSNIQITFKLSKSDALVWAVDLRTHTPLANAQAAIYSENGSPLTLGMTDSEGVLRTTIPPIQDPYSTFYAMVGQPGDEDFGLALSTWSLGIEAGDFGYRTDYNPADLKVYLYTDRPIYRPGQTVYFRAIARQASNGRYSLPGSSSLHLKLTNQNGEEVSSFDLSYSTYGTAHGEYTLPPNAQPGFYRLEADQKDQYINGISIQVADYRKPEINLEVNFGPSEALAGQPLSATVDARYFYDAPASSLPVHWALYSSPSNFDLPGYQVGPESTVWLADFPAIFPTTFGTLLAEGDAKTSTDGLLALDLPVQPVQEKATRRLFTLEVTGKDESGLPVSARAKIQINPAPFYAGVRPDVWAGQAGSSIGFEVKAVDWNAQPAGQRSLRAEFQKVIWVRKETTGRSVFDGSIYVPQYTPAGLTDFVTGADGVARLEFTPSEPGTYQLTVRGEGAQTQVTVWVGGAGQSIWPNLPNQRLHLTADRSGYRPGDTAQVFIPNPFGKGALALVTMERGAIMHHQIITIEGSGVTLPVPLGNEYAPNVYLVVTLLGQGDQNKPEFRQGYLNLPVEPIEQVLNVSLTRNPDRLGPGDEVTLHLLVTDTAGKPVQGEFSLSVVDLAALALADPNAPEIAPAFYGQQPLGVRTALDLTAAPWRIKNIPGGMGGGGGEGISPVVRQNFPDTAYWNPEVITDASGQTQVTLRLPDTLTTWQILARGVTADTRVGQDETQVIATKDLLVRPVTPRFLVNGDHALLAAIVQNNTPNDLRAEVSLQAPGFTFDDPPAASQQVNVAARGRARVEWWGTAQDVESIDLTFSASSGSLQDAAKPPQGALPVLSYSSPQAFATSGVLSDQEQRLELVNLPRSAIQEGRTPQGTLHLDLAPSLASAILKALDELNLSTPFDSNEGILSRFLPALEIYRVLQSFGIDKPELKQRLERTLAKDLQSLRARQNQDGGWGWWPGLDSNPSITAYILFGLSRARQAGANPDSSSIQKAIEYLRAGLIAPAQTRRPAELDRLAFEHFALAYAGVGDQFAVSSLYEERASLSPWGRALLALTLETISPGNSRTATLLSDLQSQALRSGAGSHWEDPTPGGRNLSTPLFSTAAVVYALAQREPASPLIPDAVRYLMAHRGVGGGWSSSYETAWTLIALAEVMKGTGELNGSFSFSASLNQVQIASGQAAGETSLAPVAADVPVETLSSEGSNGLVIERSSGAGRLYYRASLQVAIPVESAAPLNKGIIVTRAYYASPADTNPIQSAQAGSRATVRLTIAIPNDMYYLAVEDYIPAGAEILDISLKTSQQGEGSQPAPLFDPLAPFASGWGWWAFQKPQIYDNRILWAADFLPAGTYELTYTLVIVSPGEYRVLPAHAWESYFPDVEGSSAGVIFEIKPEK